MASRQGRDPRKRIVDAAWDAVGEAGAEQLLGGVSLRDVAKRLGVSPSTVTYHFSGPAELGRAMAEALFVDGWQLPHDRAAEVFAEDAPFGEAVRAAAQANWEELTAGWSQVHERRLMRLFAATGGHPAGLEAATRLADGYFAVAAELNAVLLDEVLARHGRRWVEPFTSTEAARLAGGLLERLLQQWMVDPDAVRPDLGVDAVVAMVSGLTVSADRHLGVEELQAFLDSGPEGDPGDGHGAGELAAADAARAAIPIITTRTAAANRARRHSSIMIPQFCEIPAKSNRQAARPRFGFQTAVGVQSSAQDLRTVTIYRSNRPTQSTAV